MNQSDTGLLSAIKGLLPTSLSNGFFKVSLQEYIAIVLSAGSAIIGKVGIDQTTDGTTNLVVVKNRVTTVSSGSGTITTGGVAQNVLAADSNGYNYFIQNNSTGDLWFSTLATAVASQPSIRLPAGAVYETPDSLKAVGALSVLGATTGQAFTVRKWG